MRDIRGAEPGGWAGRLPVVADPTGVVVLDDRSVGAGRAAAAPVPAGWAARAAGAALRYAGAPARTAAEAARAKTRTVVVTYPAVRADRAVVVPDGPAERVGRPVDAGGDGPAGRPVPDGAPARSAVRRRRVRRDVRWSPTRCQPAASVAVTRLVGRMSVQFSSTYVRHV
ncbi:hypothetical protein GCM10027186_07420 [Micromonospora schwarzwaldensis]